MQPEPARCNGAFDAGAELVRRATGLAECGIDKLDVNPPSCTASTALAISTSLRAAACPGCAQMGERGSGSPRASGCRTSSRGCMASCCSAAATVAARRLPIGHISALSNRADPAIPENQPQCGSTGTRARRRERPLGLPRNSARCRSCLRQARIQDRTRNAIAIEAPCWDCRHSA
jgi:hypothetical protein